METPPPDEPLLWTPIHLWSSVGPLLFIVQLVCMVHVLRTGRPYWWFWIIFAVPLFGVLAYLLVEVRPSLAKLNWQAITWRLKSADERIRILRERLADSGTVRNRLALADELRRGERFDDECVVLAEGLRGPFKDDAMLQMRLAQAQLDAGRLVEAEQLLAGIVPERSSDSQYTYALLRTRAHDQAQRAAEAEQGFQELIARERSEAARYYYAEHLWRNGRAAEATTVLRDIQHKFRRGTRVWRFQERLWYDASRRLLKKMAGAK